MSSTKERIVEVPIYEEKEVIKEVEKPIYIEKPVIVEVEKGQYLCYLQLCTEVSSLSSCVGSPASCQ
jgi:hypothetical protein